MQRTPSSITFGLLGVCTVLGLAASACAEADIDARSLAEALSEEFTVNVEFDDPTEEEQGQPPAPHPGDPRYPQLSSLDDGSLGGELELNPGGAPFTVTLQGVWNEPPADWRIAGAAVYVVQANKDDWAPSHLRVLPVNPPQDGELTLSGTLQYAPELAGNSFQVVFGLLVQTERDDPQSLEVGNYIVWPLVLPAPYGEGLVPMCSGQAGNFYPASDDMHDSGHDSTGSFYPANLRTVGSCPPEADLATLWRHALAGYIEPLPGEAEFRGVPSGTRFQPIRRPQLEPYGPRCWVQLDCQTSSDPMH
jgi:hypothetical protein